MKIQRSLRILLCLILTIGFATVQAPPAAQAGSFDSDDYDDLAIGVSAEDVGGVSNAGLVNILDGSAAGIDDNGQDFIEYEIGEVDPGEELDFFGSALAMGDFDCDGHHDLAIGTPAEDVSEAMNAGVVHVVYGTATGLSAATGANYLHQGLVGLPGTPELADSFGAALAAGDFDGDGCDDLAIGVPNQEAAGAAAAGMVHVVYGDAVLGLNPAGYNLFSQSNLDLSTDSSESADHFGEALVAADFNGDGIDDLAVGAPGEDIETAAPDIFDGGAVDVIYADPAGSGLGMDGAQHIWSVGLGGDLAAENDDAFGSVLAAGDFDADGFADLAIGIPNEDLTVANAGAVGVAYGGATGLSPLFDSDFFTRASFGAETPAAGDGLGSALAAGDFDGNRHDDLAIGFPDFDFGIDNIGQTRVIYGVNEGLTTTGWDSVVQGFFGTGGNPEANDRLGYSLAAGNFNGDAYADLVVGVPYEDDDGVAPQTVDAGAIHVIYGRSAGIAGALADYVFQGNGGVSGGPESGDRFGEVLAAVPTLVIPVYLPLTMKP